MNTQNASLKDLEDSLGRLGDGLEISGICRESVTQEDFKICITTEDPTVIFDACAQFGRIKSIKINEAQA